TGATTAAIEVATAGDYSVLITNQDSQCTDEDSLEVIYITDTEIPTITCPADLMEVSADKGICQATQVDLGISTVSDNCTANEDLIITNDAPEIFEVGKTVVTWTVKDATGNLSSCEQIVIVKDNEAPVLEEMNDITVNNDPTICGAVVNFGVVGATDNCELDSVEITEGFESGSVFPVGETTVTYTVTDVNDNISTESFTVTVVDNETPEISCPSAIIVGTETGVSYATVDFENATATDNCSVSVEQTGGPVSGSQFEIGVTTITFTATDASGNTSECSFTITVEDNEDPTISCPADINQNVDAGVCGAVVNFETPSGLDNSGNVTVEQTAGLESGQVFPVGITTISFTAKDAAGNSITCSFKVTVADDEAPVIDDINNITTNTDAGICGAIVNFTVPNATDNCEVESVILTEGLEPGTVFPVGVTKVTYTATDNNGNIATSSFTVTVVDNDAPSIECPDSITVNVENGVTGMVVNYATVTTTDNCEGTTVELTSGIASGQEFPVGETVVTYTVTDASGNFTTCSFTVTVDVNDPAPAPTAPDVEVTQATCALPTGTILVTVIDGLTYSIDGENYQESGLFETLAPGTYQVTAMDSLGQISDTTEVTINEPVAATIETNTIDLCVDDSVYDLFDLLLGDYDDSGMFVDTNNTGALDDGFIDPSLLEVGTYQFTYQVEGNCPSSTLVTVSINNDCVVLACSTEDIRDSISKAVTPNGDRINDTFEVDPVNSCGFTYDVKIFNRWGAKVFEANDYQNDWDGYSDSSFTSSNQLPSGTYFYIVEFRNNDFQPIQGYIYLGTK
ncbi:HYR domain-containing protein, partial [Christiangramia antarctica]